MATLLELKDQIIIDAQILGDNNFLSPRLNRMINLAQRYVQTLLNDLGMKNWESNITPTLTTATYSGEDIKTISVSDITNMAESPKAIIQIECDDTSVFGIAREVPEGDFGQLIINTYEAPTLKEPRFMRLSGLVYLSPSTITVAKVHYYKTISDLSVDDDNTGIPLEFEEYIIRKVVSDIQTIKGGIKEEEAQIKGEISLAYQKFLGREIQKDKLEQDIDKRL